MKLWPWLRTGTAFVFHRSSVEGEMEEEFRPHLEIRAADLERQARWFVLIRSHYY